MSTILGSARAVEFVLVLVKKYTSPVMAVITVVAMSVLLVKLRLATLDIGIVGL